MPIFPCPSAPRKHTKHRFDFLSCRGTGSLEHCAEKRAEPAEGTDVVGVTDRCWAVIGGRSITTVEDFLICPGADRYI